MEVHWPLLSVLIWLPIVGGLLTLAFGDKRAAQGKAFALLVAVATLVLSLLLFPGHDNASAAMRFGEDMPWVSSFDIRYHLGVDGTALVVDRLAGIVRRVQTGRLYNYAFAMILGLIVMLAVLVHITAYV